MKVFNSNTFKKVMNYAFRHKGKFYLSVFWAIFLAIIAALRPMFLNLTIDKYFIKTHAADNQIQDFFYNQIKFLLTENQFTNVQILVGLMFFILLLEVFSQFYFVYMASWLGQDIVKDIRTNLFKHLSRFKIQYFDHEPVGKLITKCVSDMENIASIFSQGLFMIISDVLKMLIVLIFMFIINFKITIVVLAIMPIIIIATNIFQKKMKIAFNEVRNEIANLNTFVQERLTGMKIVQLFTREKIELEKFKEINEKHNKAWLKNILLNSIFFPIADIISSITLGLVIYYGALLIIQGDTNTSLGQLISFNMYIVALYTPLRQIADKFNVLQMGIIAADRVFEVLDKEEFLEKNGTIKVEHFQGDIIFKDVKFEYQPNQEVLKGINLNVNKGDTIAIVGATGAGKSTIINLLNRFYSIKSGQICIDGISVNDYDLKTLRSEIAVVLQDVFLFADTIYNNITLFDPNISEAQVYEAAQKIGIHDFIMSLPGGYEFDVKERGVMLSSGQRQLIAFLRAYVSNPSILILDEATSSIDTYSEELIQKATKILTKDRTSIVIAHRLATVKKATQIVVLDKGKIVEKGTHKELLNLDNGYYKKLYEVQFENIQLN